MSYVLESPRREVIHTKLKIECVKDVLEELESFPIRSHSMSELKKSIEKHGTEDVLYTIVKLSEANYINAEYMRTLDGRPHVANIFDLTFAGHEFLNSIRAPGVWERLKGAASEGGTACLKAFGDIAVEMLKEGLRKQLGLRWNWFNRWF